MQSVLFPLTWFAARKWGLVYGEEIDDVSLYGLPTEEFHGEGDIVINVQSLW